MNIHNPLSNLSSASLLDALGLQTKPSTLNRALTYGGIIFTGVAVGAITALLLAPKSGSALRGDISKGARELGGKASKTVTHVIERAEHSVSDARARANASDGESTV